MSRHSNSLQTLFNHCYSSWRCWINGRIILLQVHGCQVATGVIVAGGVRLWVGGVR